MFNQNPQSWMLPLLILCNICSFYSTHGYSILDAAGTPYRTSVNGKTDNRIVIDNAKPNTTPKPKKRILVGTAGLVRVKDPMALLDASFRKGFRRFDLARTYNAGKSEEIFGDWVRSRGIDRNELNIITKGGMGNDKYGDPNRPLLKTEDLKKEFELSLDALHTDHVDMYMYHRDDLRLPASQFVNWANELFIQTGKAKAWGVSNWSRGRFQEAYEFALEKDLVPPTANSPQFSLAVPKVEVWPTTVSVSKPEHIDDIEWYQRRGVELICWEVLAKGFMAVPSLWAQDEIDQSSLEIEPEIGTDAWRLHRIQQAYCHDENYRRRDMAVRLADIYGKKLPQIAMLYPLSISDNVSVIFGPEHESHLDDVEGLEDLCLDEEAMFKLGRVSFLMSNLCGGRSLLDKRVPYKKRVYKEPAEL